MKMRVQKRLLVSALLAVLFAILIVPDASARTSLKAKASANDAPAGRFFGYAVAVDDDTMVVGAPFESNAITFSGAAYVFKRSGDTWIQEAKLTPANTPTNPKLVRGFGWSVAVSGDHVVIGTSTGFAYVFQVNGTDWGQGKELSGPSGSGFGWSVATSQDRVAVGAPVAASAYVFTFDGNNLGPAAKLTGTPGSKFGWCVTTSSETVAVGAPAADSAYVFTVSGTDWGQGRELSGPSGSEFGWSVAMSNETIVVGSPGEDGAYTFRFDGTAWVQEGAPLKDTVAGSHFGYSVATDGDLLVVGAPYGQDDSGKQSGYAYVCRYDLKAKQWRATSRPRLTESDGAPGDMDEFGSAVALHGNIVLVGAPYLTGTVPNSDPELPDLQVPNMGAVSEFAINRPPVVTGATAAPPEVHAGDTVNLNGAASDRDEGDVLTYHWVQVEFGGLQPVTIVQGDLNNPQATFVAPEVPEEGATLTFQLTANDGEEDSEPVTVTVLVTKPQCQVTSHLGQKRPWILDRNTFTFRGNKGDTIILTLQPAEDGTANSGRAVLILQDRIRGVWFFRADRSTLPNQIQATLPATGEYLVTVMDDPFSWRGTRFRGDYLLSLEGVASCLQPTQRSLAVKETVKPPADACHQKESLIEGFWF